MDRIPKNKILRFHPDTMHAVRKACKLESPERINEAIDLLQEWILKQPHFVKKEYQRSYLEAILITTKCSVEKAKRRIEKTCTMRTFLPHFFDKTDAKNDFMECHDVNKTVLLPILTEDHYRICLVKHTRNSIPTDHIMDVFKLGVIRSEYVYLHDYCQGFVVVFDYRAASIMEIMSKINLNDFQNSVVLFTEGYGFRVKGIHFVTHSKMIDALLGMFKQVLSAKLSSRIHVHMGVESLYEVIPKSLLPEDLGGEQRSVSTLYDELLQEMSTEDHIAHMKMMRGACTDEKLRLTDRFDEDMGISGTFRKLTFD